MPLIFFFCVGGRHRPPQSFPSEHCPDPCLTTKSRPLPYNQSAIETFLNQSTIILFLLARVLLNWLSGGLEFGKNSSLVWFSHIGNSFPPLFIPVSQSQAVLRFLPTNQRSCSVGDENVAEPDSSRPHGRSFQSNPLSYLTATPVPHSYQPISGLVL